MSFDWDKAAEQTGPPKMDEGWHIAMVDAVYTSKRDGTLYESPAGRYIMLVCENEQGEQATLNLWCTHKAAGYLIRTLEYLGVDREKVKQAGLTPADFLDQKTAAEWFVGNRGYGLVTHSKGGKYANIEFQSEESVPTSFLQGGSLAPVGKPEGRPIELGETIDDDDIPF